MYNDYKEELIEYIKNKNCNDVFTNENIFFQKYDCNLYIYIRVSTGKQDFGRQIEELHEWAKKKNITIMIDNIYCDKYTGKSINRPAYQELKKVIKSGDYLITANLSRLGRNWDAIKKEWYDLEYNHINRIITDNIDLSVELPNEKKQELSLGRKMIQDIAFSACLYSACMKIKEVSESTKYGLVKARKKGKRIGKPRGTKSSKDNFINTLTLMINDGIGQKLATRKTGYPETTFKKDLKALYEKYNTKNYQELLNYILKDDSKWE